MKNKLLVLLFLVSSFYQISMGNEQNMISQEYKQVENINEIPLKDSYLKTFEKVGMQDIDKAYVFFINMHVRTKEKVEWSDIKGSLDITKDNKILRTVNFDFSNNEPIKIMNYDDNSEFETRVLLRNSDITTYVNLINNDLKDVVVIPKIFIKNLDSHAYDIQFQTGIFDLGTIGYELKAELDVPMFSSSIRSLNPNQEM